MDRRGREGLARPVIEDWVNIECNHPKRRIRTHLVSVERPWRYTLKTGEEARYLRLGGGMAVHIGPGRVRLRLEAMCSALTGRILPFQDGNTEHHATRNLKRFDCPECRVALDQALERAAVNPNKNATLEVEHTSTSWKVASPQVPVI